MSETKPSNPKDAIGVLKASMSYLSAPVILEVAVGMHEGGFKYGRHNYRVIGVRGSVYYDATMRHLMAWWEGEDLDPDSANGVHHVSKAIASLVVLRDAMIQGKFADDRPPKTEDGWMLPLHEAVKKLAEKYPTPVSPYTQEGIRQAVRSTK